MRKKQSLIRSLKTKSVKIHLGERTYRMRLLTLAIFGLAVVVLLIAIIVLIIVNAISSSTVQDNVHEAALPSPTPFIEDVDLEPEPVKDPVPGEDPDPDNNKIEPEDPNGPDEPYEPIATPEESPAPTDAPEGFTKTLKSGDSDEIVKVIQQRLVDLYYMDYPVKEHDTYSVTSLFGPTSSAAIKLFQERNDISPTGECDPATYTKLMSSNASPYIMKKNDKCKMVEVIQNKLKEKGYLDKVTGFCGNETITAVTNFQKASGINPDGIAGPGTLKLLLGH